MLTSALTHTFHASHNTTKRGNNKKTLSQKVGHRQADETQSRFKVTLLSNFYIMCGRIYYMTDISPAHTKQAIIV